MSKAHKRLTQEFASLQAEPNPLVNAKPCENDILQWYFILSGPEDSPFEGGEYFGSLKFPPEYPFKAPVISIITPNGRFKSGENICISGISHYHADTWNPSWGVRTILLGLLSFMTEKHAGIAALHDSDTNRKKLAKESRAYNEKLTEYCRLFKE